MAEFEKLMQSVRQGGLLPGELLTSWSDRPCWLGAPGVYPLNFYARNRGVAQVEGGVAWWRGTELVKGQETIVLVTAVMATAVMVMAVMVMAVKATAVMVMFAMVTAVMVMFAMVMFVRQSNQHQHKLDPPSWQ